MQTRNFHQILFNCYTKKMSKSFTYKFTVARVLTLLSIIILALSAAAWWRLVYSSPANVFDRMLANSLSSSSVTKVVKQLDDSQKLNQTSVLVTEPKQVVHAVNVLSQTTDSNSSVTTESIGTPTADFIRYNEIKTSQRNPDGNPFDFSSVVGLWGRSDDSDPESNGAQLFNQTLLGVVPFANLRQPLRGALLEQIKNDNVYKIDTATVKKQLINGRPVYTYDVTVAPVGYVRMLKNFAHGLGLTSLDQVRPEQYKNSAPLKFTFDIDVWSGQLLEVAYDSSERTETYSAYGAIVPVALPSSSVSVNELQDRLQQIR